MSPAYLLKRCGLTVYTLLVVSLIVFALTQVLPGDAATMLLGENATPAALAAIRDRLGLDAPVWVQYSHWLAGVLRGDFGTSLRTGQPVGPVMVEALGRSLLLAMLAIGFMLSLAVPLGVVAAVRRGRAADLLVGLISYVGVSLPEFVTADAARPVVRRLAAMAAGDRLCADDREPGQEPAPPGAAGADRLDRPDRPCLAHGALRTGRRAPYRLYPRRPAQGPVGARRAAEARAAQCAAADHHHRGARRRLSTGAA